MTRIDAASRVIAAARERVFAALVDSDALVIWLPPTGMTGRFDYFDPRPGGGYRLVLRYDEPPATSGKASSDSDIVEARFTEIVSDRRVVQEVEFVSGDPAFAGTMTMTWRVSDAGAGSLVEFVATDVPEGISADDHAAGMSSSLGNLARYLEEPQNRKRTCATSR